MWNATFVCTTCKTEFVAQFPDDLSEAEVPAMVMQALTNIGWTANDDACTCYRCLTGGTAWQKPSSLN